jgi:uncharacterized protein (DUF2336 family)
VDVLLLVLAGDSEVVNCAMIAARSALDPLVITRKENAVELYCKHVNAFTTKLLLSKPLLLSGL